MDWQALLRLLPVVAGSINPLAGVVAGQLMNLAEEEIKRRQAANPSLTREQIIAEAEAKWQEGIDKAKALRQKGHE